ncbi:MAG: diaminopimelate epimerase [Blautia sp.]|nr:diaminopimelate epimerase [Blautia sp.]
MKFTKMHGIGNDYVYVNCFEETISHPSEIARFVSDRHFGIGSDGLILIKPSPLADCEMEMYNLDGSKGAMCGNGIRCVAKYVFDHGIARKTPLTIATGSGIKKVDLLIEGGKVSQVKVNMGNPILDAEKIPVNSVYFPNSPVISLPLEVNGQSWDITAVSMGNPHAVTFMDSLDGLQIESIGPLFENHPAFPDRVNTEFVQVLEQNRMRMRVWERGSGETLACGTGACAVAVAAILTKRATASSPVTVELAGGSLEIFWDQPSDQVFMTGPAVEVYQGEILLPFDRPE